MKMKMEDDVLSAAKSIAAFHFGTNGYQALHCVRYEVCIGKPFQGYNADAERI